MEDTVNILSATPEPEKKSRNTEELKADFLKYYFGFKLNAAKACKQIKISRTTYKNWKNSDEAFKQAMIDAEDDWFEEAQQKLLEIVYGRTKKKPDKVQLDAIKFFLSRKGKTRGYGFEDGEVDPVVNINIFDSDAEVKTDDPKSEEPRKDDGIQP